MEKLIGYINYSPVDEIVLFSAYGVETRSNAGDYIGFTGFHAEHGSQFDLRTGTFVAPINGVFEFDFSLYYQLKYSYYDARVEVELNGRKVLSVRAQRPTDKGDHLSYFGHHWILNMYQNDRIRLKVITGQIPSGADAYNVFNGKYVRPL